MTRRSALALLTLVLALCFGAAAAAQGIIPSGVFVRDAAGELWLVVNGERLAVPIYPAGEDQIAAVPTSGRWVVPAADGSLTIGDRPDWAVASTPPPAPEPSPPTAASLPSATTATVQEPPAQPGLRLVASGFGASATSGRLVGYAFVVENTHPTHAAQRTQFQAAAYDPSGAVLKTESGFVELILPGQKLGVGNVYSLEEGQTVAHVEIQLNTPRLIDPQGQQPLGVENVALIEERLALRATGIVKSAYPVDLKTVRVSAVPFDHQDNIIGGGFAFVDFIPANGQAATSVTFAAPSRPARVELYPVLTILSR